MDELSLARLKKQRERMNDLQRWTPKQALEACLADLEIGEGRVEAIAVVVSFEGGKEGERYSYVEQYCGTDGTTGPKETFWVVGMLTKAVKMWLS